MVESKQKSIHGASISDESHDSNASNTTNNAGGERYALTNRSSESNPPERKFAFSHKSDSSNDTGASETIEDHVRRMATKAGQNQLDWQASYTAMLNNVSGFYANKINEIVDPINEQLTHYLNGLRWDIEHKPEEILRQAQHDFDSTRNDALNYTERYTQFKEKLVREQKIFPDLEEEDVRKTQTKSTGDWVMFFGLLAILVLIESGANTTLLSSVIEGGIVGAFIIATLVSIINVVGIGTGLGFLYDFLLRKVPRNLFYITLPVWLGCALLLNLEVGRHREKFVLDIEAKEQAAENASIADSVDSLQVPTTLVEELTDVSFNLSSWQFESVLFFILGVVLCCFGFYKGFSFRAPGENLKSMLESIDNLKQKIGHGIENIPLESGTVLTTLREHVGQRFQQFDDNRREAQNRMQDMEHRWDQIITVISAEFINSYNNAHPQQKITSETLKQIPMIAKFPATAADKDTLTEAAVFIDGYRTTGQSEFFNQIRSVNQNIADLREEYRAAVRVIMTSGYQDRH